MLTASEFTVGSIGQATPLSLVLPRHDHEETILIAQCQSGPAAFFLSERERFKWFESSGNNHWHGLIIPNVRIEVDESSITVFMRKIREKIEDDPSKPRYLVTIWRVGYKLAETI